MDITWNDFQKTLEKLSENLACDIFNYLGSIESRPVGRDEVEDEDIIYTVDTCWLNDINAYETRIKVRFKNGKIILPWVIVEYYLNEEEALLGHNQWVEYVTDESPTFFASVQDKNIYGFTREGM